MPDLDLTQDGLRDRRSLLQLEAIMLAADDAELRSKLERLSELRHMCEQLEAGQFAISCREAAVLIRNALALPADGELDEATQRLHLFGGIAGCILLRLLAAHDCGLNDTIARARDEIGDLMRRERVRIGDSTIRDTVWPNYRTVAHFWAARETMRQTHGKQIWPCRLQDLPELLAIAEHHRLAGERLRLKRSPDTALPPGRTWRVPTGIELPAVEHSWERR